MSENTQITPLKAFNQVLMNPKTKNYLSEMLGKKSDQYVNNIAALVGNDKKLQECEPMSVIMAGIKATALDLPLDNNLGFAYVIPFKDRKNNTTLAQFQLSYKGFIQLAMRSGAFKTINTTDVKEGEIISTDFLSGENVYKRLPEEERLKAKTIGYVAYFKLLSGFEKSLYMSIEEIKAHAKQYSQTYKQGFGIWVDNFEQMALKTPLKRLLSKYAPMSVEMKNAIMADQTIRRDIDAEDEFADNEKEPTEKEIEIARQITEKFGNKIKVDDIPATNFEEVGKTDSAQTENPELFKEQPKK